VQALLVSHLVFRSGLVAGPNRILSFDRVVRVNIFKKNQNDVVLVKKKKSMSCNRVFDQVLLNQLGRRVTLNFSFPCFFLTRSNSSPGSAKF
jgi:hypothetical protein